MQTTLLSIAIALILALLAALLGPHVIRWNDHRAFFEAEASRLVGIKVLVGGDIDAVLLPSPSVTLRAIAIGPAGSGSRMRAKTLRIELALGPLMRGDLRATEMKLVSPQFNIGLDDKGKVDWPSLALASDTLSIDRLSIEDGHAVLTDAVSKTRTEIDQLWFSGEVRSLTGPIRGKGEFVTGGGLYGYDVSASRAGDEGMRVKLGIKTDERPLTAETEGLLAFDDGAPRFDGTLSLSQPAAAVMANGKAAVFEPWRLTSKIKADSGVAKLDDVAFQYGPDERAVTLAGSAQFQFGAKPQLQGTLSARQVDLDRLLATPEMPRRLPLAAAQAFGDMLGSALRPSWPLKLALNIDTMTLGGTSVQNVASELRSDGGTWTLDRLELRAPGFTQVKLDGRLYPLGKGLGFAGGVNIDSNDPKNLMAWLAGHATTTAQYKPWRAKGDVTFRPDRIAVEHLRTEIDKGVVEGSVAYTWPVGDKPARLDGELRTAELDLEGAIAFGESAFSGMGLERPSEIALAVEIGHGKIAGFDARNIAAKLKLEGGLLAVERLSIGNLGETSFVASGRIQTQDQPGGSITVNLDSRDLNGILAVTEKFTPALAEPLRRIAARQKTAALQANISMESSGADGANGKIGLTGKIGVIRVNLSASATGKRDAFVLNDLGALAGADARIEGRLESDDAAPLLGLIGLGDAVASDGKAARLDVSASGPLSREMKFEGKLATGSIDAGGKGTLTFAAAQPAFLKIDQFDGSIGGSKVQGSWSLRLGDTPDLNGSIQAETLDVPSIFASAIGVPAKRMSDGANWSSEPVLFNPAGLTGHLDFKAESAVFSPWLSAKGLSGVARFNGSEVLFENVAGELGNGHLDGRLSVSNDEAGLAAKLRVALNGAEIGALFPGDGRAANSGRMTVQAELEGSGRSPAAFIGSLSGFGSLTLEKARLAGLNPNVFGAVTRALELGIPTEGVRMQQFVTGTLDSAGLPVEKASATIGVSEGQARLRDIAIDASGASLQATVNLDLSNAMVDALLTLNGVPQAAGAPKPALLVALKGTLPAPKRSIDTNLLTSWLTLREIEQQSKQLDAMERAEKEKAARDQAARQAEEAAAAVGKAAETAKEAPPPLVVTPPSFGAQN